MRYPKIFLTAIILQFITISSFAQIPQVRCGTMQHLEYLKQQDPGLESRMAAEEQKLQDNISSGRFQSPGIANAPIVVRVVVHVVWNNAAQNISDAQVLSQIDVLNEDYNRYNTDAGNTPSVFTSVAGNSGIHFCLATTDPNGNPTTGINRVQTNITSFGQNDGVKSSLTGGVDAWDPNTYLNIWVCNLGAGLLGYAQFPGGPISTNGVVILFNAFGRTGNLISFYSMGRTTTHEIGHVFNLRHIWGDANCGNDFVADTPVQQDGNFGCPTFPTVSCTNGPNGDMFMNFMDYTDDVCMNLFTQDQGTRMRTSIYSSYPGIISNLDCVTLRNKISGFVYYDINQNGQKDVGENGMFNKTILRLPDSVITTTDISGEFINYLHTGPYVLELQPNSLWNIIEGNSGYSIVVDTMALCCNDFGVTPATLFDDISINYSASQYRCGFTVPAWITVTNDGTSIVNGMIRYVPHDSMTFISANPAPDNVSGDTLYFNFSNLFPGQSLTIQLFYEMPLTPGLLLCSNTVASVYDGSTYQPFTEDLYCDEITCSFDPNDKKVIPPGVQPSHYILKTDTLLYTVRFQNEGNDTAFTVVIRDQLSSLLNRNTVELVASSHPVIFSINTANLAEFRFENILLPHKSINESGSQGFVTFRIVPFQGLPDGTVINNEAGIYFDYNPPVITNTAFVTLVTTIPVGINEISGFKSLNISPQPFTNYCEINITDEDPHISEYRVYDISGREITFGTTLEGMHKQIRLNTTQWDKGIYFIRIKNLNSGISQTSKLLKQ
ncbi:MAG: T9SS type A sorting domain-containing protein [Bacteroidetes bacterium]|nr:T9SS type A sorting domain-containing protein [Bacteroidota bacterium]